MIENIKGKFLKIRERCNKLYLRWREYVASSFGDTQRGLYIMSTLVIVATIGEFISNWFINRKIGFLIGVVLGLVIVKISLGFLTLLLKFLLRNGEKNLVYTVAMGVNMILLASYASYNAGLIGNLVYAVMMFFAMIVFAKSLWAFAINLKRTKTIYISMGISGIIVVVFCIMMVGKGFMDTYISRYLSYNMQVQQSDLVEGFEDIDKNGKYQVKSFEYSPCEADVKTETVDLTRYVFEEEWYNALYRSFFQEYTLETAPIAGKVWYPKDKKKCPVIFIVHGNHSIKTPSYLGYEYLGEYLASYGYVVVSVDENVLNQRNNEIDARAILLLENIKAIEKFNLDEKNPLYGVMDFKNIALVGHSRGGEAIATAYVFNELDSYPSNGSFKLNYNFNIRSLLAIAPSVEQYNPGGHKIELENVNYLVLQGANDQDVTTFQGNVQYEKVSFSKDADYIKSSLYIAGANHGQFNSKWGLYDYQYPITRWLNVGNFIKSKEQKKIAKIFAKVFFDKTLCDGEEYSDLLTNYAKYSQYLPKTVYVQQYVTSDFKKISDFEEDADLETATNKNVSILAKNMAVWSEEMLMFSGENFISEKENHAMYLKWIESLESQIEFSFKYSEDLKNSQIQFDICDINEENVENTQILDFKVILKDSNKNEIFANVKDFVTIYPPLPVKLSKVQYLSKENEMKKHFQTIAIPVYEFESNTTTFDYSNVESIKFVFDKTDYGVINIDNVGIVK